MRCLIAPPTGGPVHAALVTLLWSRCFGDRLLDLVALLLVALLVFVALLGPRDRRCLRRFLCRLAVVGQFFQLSLELGPPSRDLFHQFVGLTLPQSLSFFDATSIATYL